MDHTGFDKEICNLKKQRELKRTRWNIKGKV